MNYEGSRVLITGGLGFIGSHVARSLVNLGASVKVVDNLNPDGGGNKWNIADVADDLEVHIADVRDSALMDKLVGGCDFIFNLAAQTSHTGSMKDPYGDLQINAHSQLSLVESCRKYNPTVKIVYASTRQLYGRPQYLPVDEAHPIRAVDVNGISKLAGEQFHLLYNDVYGIRATVLRLTNTYGPRMRIKDAQQTFIGIWVRRLLEGQSIQVFGQGTQLRDFLYVDDCVTAILKAGLSAKANGKVFNVGTDEVVCLLDLAKMMTANGTKGRLELVPFPPERKVIDIGDYYSNCALIQSELNWQSEVMLEEGLSRTMEFFGANFANYV